MSSQSLIVFDMDGVLVDVSGSYREAVRQTARLFLGPGLGFAQLPDPLFSLSDLAAVKQSGGLNNDWDLTAVILKLLFSQIRCPAADPAADPWTRYTGTVGKCDLSGLARFLAAPGTCIRSLLDSHGKASHGFIDSLYAGDVGSGNVIKQIFQEIYLGQHLFTATYDLPPRMSAGDGLINRETLLAEPVVLEALATAHTLAIATGRPRAEAGHALAHFGIEHLFSTVYTLDDCLREEARIRRKTGQTVSLSKPHPYMLDAVAGDPVDRFSRRFYIGDMPDDMAAARNASAGFTGIGFSASSPDRKKLTADLLRAGAHRVVANFSELAGIVN